LALSPIRHGAGREASDGREIAARRAGCGRRLDRPSGDRGGAGDLDDCHDAAHQRPPPISGNRPAEDPTSPGCRRLGSGSGGAGAGGVKEAVGTARDQVERTDFYINLIKDWVARGGRPSAGGKVDPDGTRREGWTGNACYHAALMPCYVRVLEHFEVPFRQKP